jgi:hypothetical protein
MRTLPQHHPPLSIMLKPHPPSPPQQRPRILPTTNSGQSHTSHRSSTRCRSTRGHPTTITTNGTNGGQPNRSTNGQTVFRVGGPTSGSRIGQAVPHSLGQVPSPVIPIALNPIITQHRPNQTSLVVQERTTPKRPIVNPHQRPIAGIPKTPPQHRFRQPLTGDGQCEQPIGRVILLADPQPTIPTNTPSSLPTSRIKFKTPNTFCAAKNLSASMPTKKGEMIIAIENVA